MIVKMTDRVDFRMFQRMTFEEKLRLWIRRQLRPCRCGWFAHTEWPRDLHVDVIEALGKSMARKIDDDIQKLLTDAKD